MQSLKSGQGWQKWLRQHQRPKPLADLLVPCGYTPDLSQRDVKDCGCTQEGQLCRFYDSTINNLASSRAVIVLQSDEYVGGFRLVRLVSAASDHLAEGG